MSCTYPCPGGWGLGALHAGRGDSRCKASRPGGRGLTQGQGGEGSGLSGRALSAASGHHSIPREEGRHSPLQGGQVHQDRALSCHIPGALSPPLVCVCHPHTTPPAPHTPLTPMTFWNDCFSPWVRGHTVDSWPDTSRQTCLVKVIFEKHESNINAQET